MQYLLLMSWCLQPLPKGCVKWLQQVLNQEKYPMLKENDSIHIKVAKKSTCTHDHFGTIRKEHLKEQGHITERAYQ